MSGQSRYRHLWEGHFADCDAVVFVVDSSDRFRFVVAKDELQELFWHPEFREREVPVLVLANKADYGAAAGAETVARALDLEMFSSPKRPCLLLSCSALDGRGLVDGASWLLSRLKERLQQERAGMSPRRSAHQLK
uniref:ADP-ribosylation factor-like protein 6 n=1 Tax=Chromera velia CCMP2878 TaxID=1169474 RepID=A0A0G4I2N6_9ALVE|eukprot:Cvel_1726.t1-p1 / transcript=Cvel_1726.t1 / gene=Cvel_1726 / organism=Chromera_velia_CCMP2878 / gene_product=ADP-ribosylation factor-like protein 6, putative / transcript_product=ADP-ribosylation factor-like protein 6, putative / location=Cvel_scaffold62:137931-140280(-) / protein_length=135 / sequence_SO=supercontig / SO=protein_coding / is_pseudo=false